MSFYSGIYKVLARPVRAIFKCRVEGIENMPAEGGAILCANHTGLLDVVVMSAALNRQIRYMAKKELFKIPLLSRLIRALGAFPVDRGGADVKAIRNTISMIEGGEIVGIFPQGTRCPGVDPRTTEVKNGVGMIAYRAKSNVVPVYIKTKNNKTRLFTKTTIIVGKPIEYEELGYEKGGNAEYKAASELIFDRICTLGERSE